ncbi:ACP S-malonyltransferase [Streptomyces sp. NPDC058374]|uniref:ACP S-malonyltransferase n=1 Tax=unclassified Streptomyces TaxID=2593676 RepID=UPI003647DB45
MRTVWLFPGQGAQTRGMGAELFGLFPDLVRQADEILGYSLRELCEQDTGGRLRDTRYAQPALFAVNALGGLARERRGEPRPDALAGHSLGEYNALFAAGCFDFATGIRLVRERGTLMGRANGGGMTAVLGADADALEALLEREGITELDIANHNSAVQLVLSGPVDALRKADEAVRRAGSGRCVPLKVSAAFHSRYMAQAAGEFAAFLGEVDLQAPQVPVVANVTARPYNTDPRELRATLAEQIRRPVRWWESMSLLLAQGAREAVEVGPGRTLTGLWEAARKQPAPVPESVPPVARTPRSARLPSDPQAAPVTHPAVSAGRLGCAEFRRDYRLRQAYLAGSMFKGIASAELVIRMARAGLMGFFGSGGLRLEEIDKALDTIRGELGPSAPFGVNLLSTPDDPAREAELVRRCLDRDVRHVEAAAFTQVTRAVVHFRFSGARIAEDGTPVAHRHVVAKVSRPEVAAAFAAPPPRALLDELVAAGELTPREAAAARLLPVSGDLCVEADSGGHTDAGNPYALIPAMVQLRDEAMRAHGYAKRIRVGAAGGLGSPAAVAAAFVLGADFVVTGSVNQCSPEAGTSDAVKDLLAGVDVQDTAYAPAGDMFELGARVQVVRKGTLFAARANKLYQVYRQYGALEEIDAETRTTIERRYFRRSFDEVWAETRARLAAERPQELARAEASPKHRMALVFRWYFVHANRMALAGSPDERVNYQIHCGPALGAFNRWAAGTELADWRNRHVEVIADRLMRGAAEVLGTALPRWSAAG